MYSFSFSFCFTGKDKHIYPPAQEAAKENYRLLSFTAGSIKAYKKEINCSAEETDNCR